MQRFVRSSEVHNVLLFGESMSGKSSVVNMIIGNKVANTSGDPTGYTFEHQEYLAPFDAFSCSIFDIAGLNEADLGRVPRWEAIRELYTLIRKLESVSLLICCVRGGIKENTHANWTLFHDVICGGQVPGILVVELEGDFTSKLNGIKDSFGIDKKPKDVLTVSHQRLDMYEKSRKRLWELISKHSQPWRTDKKTWFADIYLRAYSESFALKWFGVGTKVQFGQEFRSLVQKFGGQGGMNEGKLKKLEETLLAAEQKIARQEPRVRVHNVLLFGESGSGKSSVVKMLIGNETSSNHMGCTFEHQDYLALFDTFSYNIFDIAGLNEGDQGHVPHWKAIRELYTLIGKLDSVSLLICCVRGRMKANTYANWTLFHDVICGGQVPGILVVSGLEQGDWDSASKIDEIKDSFGVDKKPKDVLTVVSHQGEFVDMYGNFQMQLRHLISKHCRPWSTDKDTWFANIYLRAYNESLFLSWFGVDNKVQFGQEFRSLVQTFAGQRGISEGELKNLEETLFAAEKKIARQTPRVHNVLLFGESGSGKSSVVNMIIGDEVAKTSSDPTGCTFEHQDYPASIDKFSYNIFDTAGLNEGDQGRVPHWEAISELYTLIRKLDSVSLLICCVRGRIKENTHANWTLFHDVICGGNVPVLLVVTGLEQEDDWDSASRLERLKDSFGVYKMKPADVLTVVSIRGLQNEFAKLYEKSQEHLRELILKHHRPWSTDKDTWFADIYFRAYSKSVVLKWFGVGTKVEFGQEFRSLVQNFARQTGIGEGESKRLEETLLAAERKIARKETGFASRVLEFVIRKDEPTIPEWNLTSKPGNKDESEQQKISGAAGGGRGMTPQGSFQAGFQKPMTSPPPDMARSDDDPEGGEQAPWNLVDNDQLYESEQGFPADAQENDQEKGRLSQVMQKGKRLAKTSLKPFLPREDKKKDKKEVESKKLRKGSKGSILRGSPGPSGAFSDSEAMGVRQYFGGSSSFLQWSDGRQHGSG